MCVFLCVREFCVCSQMLCFKGFCDNVSTYHALVHIRKTESRGNKMQRKDIFNLTDKLTIFRIDFRDRVNSIKKEYEETKKNIPNEFIGKRRDIEYQKAEQKYKNDWEELKESWRKDLIDTFEEMEVSARAKAGVINSQLLEQARVFLDVPITVEEFGSIVHALGNRNYYVDRVLETIAEKNGITKNGLTPLLEPLELEPCLDVKLSVLADLKSQAMDIIENYGTINEDVNSRTGDLFPDVLRRAENLYTNGLHADDLTAEQVASRVIDAIRYSGGHGNIIIDNALSNADVSVRRALMNDLCTSVEHAVVYAVQKSKARAEISEFKQNESALYSVAKQGMDELRSMAGDESARDLVISKFKGNPYFDEMLESEKASKTQTSVDGMVIVQE